MQLTMLPIKLPELPQQELVDLATLLRWIKEGKEDQVLAHLDKLSLELQPLVDLLIKRKQQ